MPQLLIIDDDESTRKVLRYRLKNSYEIIDSGSPEEALELALHHKPDAILLDLMMPKYSGLEVCQTLSSLSFTQHIPILIVSGESSNSYKDYCESIGAKGFFQKPIDVEALQTKLASLIGSKNPSPKEPRVRLRVGLILRGTDSSGNEFELTTATEEVGRRSFLCGCPASLNLDATIDVRFAKDAKTVVGKAHVTRIDWPGSITQRCEFQFAEKPANWILG